MKLGPDRLASGLLVLVLVSFSAPWIHARSGASTMTQNRKVAPQPRTSKPDSQSAPWTLHIDDGSHNLTTVKQPAEGPATWWYAPVKAAESSSGEYSGGEPAQGTVAKAQLARLWDILGHAERSAESPAPRAREMGTLQVDITSPRGHRGFVIPRQAAGPLELWLDELRHSARHP